MSENTNKLSVRMMGGFHMYLGNREIRIKSSSSTKAAHILQLVLFHAPNRVQTDYMIEQIFSDSELLDPNNNLKASLTLLRKQLLAGGMPRIPYITFRDRGYIWTEQLPPELDTQLFEAAASKGLRVSDERAIKPCLEASRLYNGRFLPELEGCQWVEQENARLEDLYTRMMIRLASLMSAAGRQEELLPHLEKACKLLPGERWETLRMQCLMDLHRWDEAKKVYSNAVGQLARDEDIQPPAELTARYKELSSHLVLRTGDLREIVDYIREENAPSGAYCCTFPGFVDAARVAIRTMERTERPCYILLCTLVDLNGEALEGKKLETASEYLGEALSHGMRRSDFYTRYNLNQYLIFLQGTELANCKLVEERVEEKFRAYSVRGARLKFDEYTAKLKALDELER